MKTRILFVAFCLFLASCATTPIQPAEINPADPPTLVPTMPSLPNPASVFCEQQGGKSEIRTAADGSQAGYCIFPDGSECDEWAYFRGECAPASQAPGTPTQSPELIPSPEVDPGKAFCDLLGYTITSVTAPDGSPLEVCQFPDGSTCNPTALLKGLCAPASQLGSMPNAASNYCQGQGFTSEIRTAADGSQSGVCIFPDARECDEWLYYRGVCDPDTALSASSAASAIDPASPTPIPTAIPVDPGFYKGFWTYTDPNYGFSIMLPEDWVVDETSTSDPAMNGHVLILHPREAPDGSPSLRMSFRNVGEDVLLWPTGVGQGEFVPGGSLDVAGSPALRFYFVCPSGQVQSIYYHGSEDQPNIQLGSLEFGFIYSLSVPYCQGEFSLTGKLQLTGELIIASLKVP